MPAETKAAPPSAFEDIVDIFYAPSSVFERRRDGRFWLALAVVAVVIAILSWISLTYLAPIYDAMYAKMAAANPNITEEQLRKGRALQQTVGLVFAPLGVAIGAFVSGLLIWLIGKIFESQQNYSQAVTVATLSMYPQILKWVAMIVQGMVLDASKLTSMTAVSLSPARFMDPATTSPVAIGLLSRVDIFEFWSLVLVAIGLSITGRIPRSRAFIPAIILWLLGSIPAIWTASRAAG